MKLLAAGGFDLSPYYPLVMGGYLMPAPGNVGMVIGFVLPDARAPGRSWRCG